MADAPRAVVTARFDLPAKSVPAFEARLRALDQEVVCNVLEVTSEQQILQSGLGAVETFGERGGLEQPTGSASGPLGAGQDGGVAGSSGKIGTESLERHADDGAHGTVSVEVAGDVVEEPAPDSKVTGRSGGASPRTSKKRK